MRKIRVLIVDDAVTMRRLLKDALSTDPDLEVAGVAENGRAALDRIPALRPDVVVLDLEMPVMGGLETLVEVRRTHPGLPVVVYTADSGPGAEVVLDALWLGASDYAIKAPAGSPTEAIAHIRAELAPRLKAVCTDVLDEPAAPEPEGPLVQRPRVKVVVIGASTGGPEALVKVLAGLPPDFPVPVAIVQHMPRLFTGFLAERLAARSPLPVAEAADGDELLPGRALVAPGDWHMTLARAGHAVRVRLDQGPPVNSCRPSVDELFVSAAEAFGPCVLAVVLTGMGQDGFRGCDRIAAARGQVIVQDERTSVVWGMPGSVARAGIAESVVPIDRLADEILHRTRARKEHRRAAA